MDQHSLFERDGAAELNLPQALRQKHQFLIRSQTSEFFCSRFGRIFAPDSEKFKLIQKAYADAEQAYHGIVRDSNGEPYMQHAIAVATLRIERSGIKSPTQVIC